MFISCYYLVIVSNVWYREERSCQALQLLMHGVPEVFPSTRLSPVGTACVSMFRPEQEP